MDTLRPVPKGADQFKADKSGGGALDAAWQKLKELDPQVDAKSLNELLARGLQYAPAGLLVAAVISLASHLAH